MRQLWDRLRNGRALWSAYRDVDILADDDLTSEQMFASLRQFAAAPSEPSAIPVELLRGFTVAQKRARGRKKFRFGAGALFATIILFPGLAYAGVLPISMARVVQRIFDVVSVPIKIPAVTAEITNSGQTTPNSDQPTTGAASQSADPQSTETSNQVTSSETPELVTSTPLLPSITISTQSTTGTPTGVGVTIPSQPSDDSELGQATATATATATVDNGDSSRDDETARESGDSAAPTATADPQPTQSDGSVVPESDGSE